jgi:hypothetical protein
MNLRQEQGSLQAAGSKHIIAMPSQCPVQLIPVVSGQVSL